MSDYTTLTNKGEPEIGEETLSVYLYPNETGDREEAKNEVYDAVKSACDEIYDKTAVQYYEIALYDYESNVDEVEDEDDGDTYFTNFKDWLGDQGYYDYNGVHLGVTDSTNFANAEYVGKGETCWVNGTAAFVGTAGGYDVTNNDTARWKNLAVQEPIHNMVSMEYTYVDDLTEGDEHDLGIIDSDGDSTPMLTFYERDDTHPTRKHDRSGKGDCAPDNTWDNTHRLDLTSCSIDAIDYTSYQETINYS
ncbi:hypothetical protein NGM10_06950 [Halorussus salilacus]|uniref:hypothetical protein n=1 Tax=Halorussus salilacus TaxID=2953750 RepID=UPI00209C73FE|nr:hypothetical protein [Halorussus salilacus]USZ69466.1 hypothetical protein NGM10_06950 [Halorussus salilacus]